MADRRRKNETWQIGNEDGTGLTWEQAGVAVLMDIRDEMHTIRDRRVRVGAGSVAAVKERYEYRVVWQREGQARKTKRYATLFGAERYVVLLGPEPWRAHRQNPDALACCDGRDDGCGGLTVRESYLAHRKDMPPVVSVAIERRVVGVWWPAPGAARE